MDTLLLKLKRIALIVFMALFAACSGGGGSSGPGGSNRPADLGEATGSINLDGPIDGAEVSVKGIATGDSTITIGRNAGYYRTTEEITLGKAVSDSGGSVAVPYAASAIDAEKLYLLTFRCQRAGCGLGADLHLVLTGRQFEAGGWQANVLTEAAYQRLAYYVAADYSLAELGRFLDNLAPGTLRRDVDGSDPLDYTDLLAWRAERGFGDVLRRPAQLQALARAVSDGQSQIVLQNQVRALFSPFVEPLALDRAFAADDYYDCGSSESQWVDGIISVVCHVSADLDDPDPDESVLLTIDAGSASLPVLLGSEPLVPGYGPHEAFAGNLAYVPDYDAAGNPTDTLQIMDISRRASPRLLSSLNLGPDRQIWSIAVRGDTAYLLLQEELVLTPVFSSKAYLYTVNIREPEAPEIATRVLLFEESLNLFFGFGGIAVQEEIAYLRRPSAVHLYDVSDPSAPRELAAVNVGFTALFDVPRKPVVRAGRLYAINRGNTAWLDIWDVSDPAVPELVSSLLGRDDAAASVPLGEFNVFSVGDNGVVYSFPGGQTRRGWPLNAYDPAGSAPVLQLGSYFSGPDSFYADQAYRDGLVFLSGSRFEQVDIFGFHAAALAILDAGQPADLREIGVLLEPNEDANFEELYSTVALEDGLACVVMQLEFSADDTDSDFEPSLSVIDVADPASPSIVGKLPLDGLVPTAMKQTDIRVHDRTAYLAAGEKFHLIDLDSPSNPVLDSTLSLASLRPGSNAVGSIADFVVDGNTLYLLASFDSLGGWEAVLYIIELARGLDLIGRLALPGLVDFPADAGAIAVKQGVVYAGNDAGLRIIDARNPADSLAVIGTVDLERISDIEVVGDFAYIMGNSGSGDYMAALDIEDPQRPEFVGTIDGIQLWVDEIDVSDDAVYLMGSDGVRVYRAVPQ